MNSHELAKLLLSRRANDIRIQVWVDTDPTGLEDPTSHRVELGDMPDRWWTVPAEELLTYDSENDLLILKAGCVYLGEAPE